MLAVVGRQCGAIPFAVAKMAWTARGLVATNKYRRFSVGLQYLQYFNNADFAVLHWGIDIRMTDDSHKAMWIISDDILTKKAGKRGFLILGDRIFDVYM